MKPFFAQIIVDKEAFLLSETKYKFKINITYLDLYQTLLQSFRTKKKKIKTKQQLL